tara:strand:- start:7833 stop:8741 length:909 start_codon:yes stop_codon:yes gene_type:complete
MAQITIGSRGSKLALVQADFVKQKIEQKFNHNVIIKVIKTAGDIDLLTPIRKIQDKGFYTKEIEDNLSSHNIDFAVHSMKDLPIELEDNFKLAAVLKRNSPMDILLTETSKNIKEIKSNLVIGVGSLRRRIQCKKLFPNSRLVDVRGNIETRIGKMKLNNWDGLIIAKSAIERLSINEKFYEFTIEEMVPAPCQGIIAIETLKDNLYANEIASAINHEDTFEISMIEREISKELGGGCTSPVGCLVCKTKNHLNVYIFISDSRGRHQINYNEKIKLDDKETLVSKIMSNLHRKGLLKIIKNV